MRNFGRNLEMTDEQILELASQFLEKGEHTDDGHCASDRFADTEDLVKFARVMYNKGQEEEIRRQKTGIGYVNGVLVMDEF